MLKHQDGTKASLFVSCYNSRLIPQQLHQITINHISQIWLNPFVLFQSEQNWALENTTQRRGTQGTAAITWTSLMLQTTIRIWGRGGTEKTVTDDLLVSPEMGKSSIFIPPNPCTAFRPSNNKAQPSRSKVVQDNPATQLFLINRSDGQWHLHYQALLWNSTLRLWDHNMQGGFEKLSKGREDTLLPALRSTQPYCRYRDDALQRIGHEGPGSSWLKLNPNFRDMMLLGKEKWFGESSSHNAVF